MASPSTCSVSVCSFLPGSCSSSSAGPAAWPRSASRASPTALLLPLTVLRPTASTSSGPSAGLSHTSNGTSVHHTLASLRISLVACAKAAASAISVGRQYVSSASDVRASDTLDVSYASATGPRSSTTGAACPASASTTHASVASTTPRRSVIHVRVGFRARGLQRAPRSAPNKFVHRELPGWTERTQATSLWRTPRRYLTYLRIRYRVQTPRTRAPHRPRRVSTHLPYPIQTRTRRLTRPRRSRMRLKLKILLL